MATFQPQYKLEVAKPRSLNDATESQPLVPVGAGATIHTDPFRVTTMQGMAGWQPYLDLPQGRKGRLDYRTKRTDVGELAFRILDKRTSDQSQVKRWATAFVGDANGEPNLAGCRVRVWESLDNGATWASFFTGRVADNALDGLNWLELAVRDTADELGFEVFVGAPHSSITYAAPSQLWPVGLMVPYGNLPTTPIHQATAKTDRGNRWLKLSGLLANSTWNLITQAFLAASGQPFTYPRPTFGFTFGYSSLKDTPLRVRIKRLDTNAVGDVVPVNAQLVLQGQWRLTQLQVEPLPVGDPAYVALPADGVVVELQAIRSTKPPTKQTPFVIGDVHPMQLWADVLDGKFSWLDASGAPLRTIPRDTAAFAALIADPSFGRYRGVLDGMQKCHEWTEKHVLVPYNVGFRVDGDGRIVPLDLRGRTSVAVAAVLTDSDLATTAPPRWKTGKAQAYTRAQARYTCDLYLDPVALAQQVKGEQVADIPTALLTPAERSVELLDFGPRARDRGDQTLALTLPGYRALPDLTEYGLPSEEYQRRRVRAVIDDYRAPYAAGAQETTLAVRRTAATSAAQVGAFVEVQLTALPDPQTAVRGGSRLARVVERSERGLTLELRLLDAGTTAPRATPTLGALTQTVSGWWRYLNVPVTRNAAGDPVELQLYFTPPTVGVRPVDSDPGWGALGLAEATGTFQVGPLPAGWRVWVRGRTVLGAAGARPPSAWVYPSAPGYLDLGSLQAPTALATVGLSGSSLTVTFTPGEWTLPTECYLAIGGVPGAWTEAMRRTVIPAGVGQQFLSGLASGATYTVGLRHRDTYGAVSAMATYTFTTGLILPPAPTPPRRPTILDTLPRL